MDPFSIAASAAGIVAFCGKFIELVGRFVVEVREVPDAITTFYNTILTLQASLQNLADVLKNRPKPLPFERDHYANIHRIIRSCSGSLRKLEKQLPVLPTDPSSMARTRATLIMNIKSDAIQQTINHIGSYTQVLQLSLMTLSLGTLWGTQRSQNQIETQIRNLTDSIRSANLATVRPDLVPAPESDPALADENKAMKQDIRAWLESANEVAAVVSLHDHIPSDSGICMELDDPNPDEFDPEPEIEDTPSCEILQHQYEENQKLVEQLVSYGIFLKASAFQRKGIEQKKRLAKAHNIPFEFSERADMEETLADILINAEMMDGRVEAKEILQGLLSEEVGQAEELRNEDRRCRLYHKLGRISLDQNDAKPARRFFHRAFEGRRKIEPMPTDLVFESGDMLVRALQLDQAFDEARGYMEWMRKNLKRRSAVSETLQVPLPLERPHSPSVGSEETEASNAFGWCKDNGFDVDPADFCFDVCDSARGTSPLHLAVQKEAIEVVQQMVDHVVSFEHRDDEFCTPLLLAAATRNHKITRVLLEGGAKVDVRDRCGRSPLHCCQSSKGGVKVAELLLNHSNACLTPLITARPEFVNLTDQSSKTALYVACEKGNEKMAQFLLDNDANPDLADNYGKTPLYAACEKANEAIVRCLLEGQANPNIQGPGQCTPLLVAIQVAMPINVKMHIIELLVAKGADPKIPDSDGQTAFTVARKHGFGSEIRRVLQLDEMRRVSIISTASAGSVRSPVSSHEANSSRPRAGSSTTKASRFSGVKWLQGTNDCELKEGGSG